jgi:hypothetical protein
MSMYKPTKTLPKHLISPSQPLHNNLARQINDLDSEGQFDLAFRVLLHVYQTIALLTLIGSAVVAAPYVLARFSDTGGVCGVPGPLEIERRELGGDDVFGSLWVDR